ncbi:IPT/TIG domain-containing protein [Pseudanabaena sp. FACHB-2040]|uniref:IPT/TIG domain-containing protein n=1 Tax=Pseudanabaena sp. FACHB-2040 TaxID=2692859 RepID=UPI00168A11A6|nr:IPT/TIG domain-containing protein [Pseudanabaena sp. FACHB-2040]
MQNSDHTPSANTLADLPNEEWELSELIQLVTAELDQAQDTLILKAQNRRLSMMVNQLSLDLQVDVRHAPNGRLMFRTVSPGQTGATVLKLGFTPALDTQVQETRRSVDLETGTDQRLETLPDIQAGEIQKLKTVGIHTVNDLQVTTQTPATLTEVSVKTGLDESRLRLWRQLPFIAQVQPESGSPGSIVMIDGGYLGLASDKVEVYFQDRLATIRERTSTRLTVEMPRGAVGSGLVSVKVKDQKTNTRPWRADVVELCVLNITLKPSASIRVQDEVTFQAALINQGTLGTGKFPVKWEVFRAVQRLPDTSAQTSLRPVDPGEDLPIRETDILVAEGTYFHAPLLAQQRSADPSTSFTARLDQPGAYRVSFTVDPDNTLLDQAPTNNQFIREFVVDPLPPAAPAFGPPASQFSPTSGRAGDRITLSGSGFNTGTVIVQFGNTTATVLSLSTGTQLAVRVPSLPPGPVKISVQTAGGKAISQDSFTVLASSYYGPGGAIGGQLL